MPYAYNRLAALPRPTMRAVGLFSPPCCECQLIALPWPAPETRTQGAFVRITWLCYACAGSNDVCGDHAEMQLPDVSAVMRRLCRYDVLQGGKDPCALIG
jgi:hypothetical protein